MKILIVVCILANIVIAQSSVGRKIEMFISGDFPKGERIAPKVITLNGQSIYDNVFVPGKYELFISENGYVPLRKKIVVPANKDFIIEEVLETLPRQVEINITYSRNPPTTLFVRTIEMIPLPAPQDKFAIKTGDFIKPGSYILMIKQYGYETIKYRQHVWPDDAAYVIEQQLRPKLRPMSILVTHDVAPSPHSPPYRVSVMRKDSRIFCGNYHSFEIYPMDYIVKFFQPGYYEQTKEMNIQPGEEMVYIYAHLQARKRRISFTVKDNNKQDAHIWQLHSDIGETISKQRELQPGQKLQLCAKFLQHKTAYFTMKIVPGEKPQILPITPQRLQPLRFSLSKNDFVIDGIHYHYDFTIDGEKIEAHHLQIHKQQKYNLHMSIEPNAQKLRIFRGYFYVDKSVAVLQNRWVMPVMTNISIPRLIHHLTHIEKLKSATECLHILKNLVRKSKYRIMLQKCSAKNRQILLQYIQRFNVQQTVELQNLLRK